MADLYTTKTAALRATKADVNKIEAKKIKVNGKDVVLGAKHANDTRETVTENDVWGQYTEVKDGQVIVHDNWISNPKGNSAWNHEITKVEDNKAYVGDTLYANIQTNKIKNGRSLFYLSTALTSFKGNLGNLEIGGGTSVCDGMFRNCSNLTTFNGNLSSLTDGTGMFAECSNLESFSSYDLTSLINGGSMFSGCSKINVFTYNLNSLKDGSSMFSYCSNLESFGGAGVIDLSSLKVGSRMFYNCTTLTTFKSDLSSLTDGDGMFEKCENLTTFESDLSSLTSGYLMFANCNNLETFTSDLSSLKDGGGMFEECDNLTTFESDLSSLTNGTSMFRICPNLESFIADLSSLIDGDFMFKNCSNLKSFTSDLSSLTDGTGMFAGCKLNPQSVLYIVESIPQRALTTTIGINVENNSATIADQLQAFAEEATFDSWDDLKNEFLLKGCSVTWQYGGSDTSITYDLRGGERIIPCPVYTQLIEISPEGVEYDEEGNETGNMVYTDEQKNRAEYTNEDGTKFYSINWGHDVTNYDDFQQFDSLEDAAAAYGIIINVTETEI